MSAITSVAATLRRISADDNAAIVRVIRQVSAEYGLTADKGYTVADPNLDELHQVYSQPGAAYWVIEQNGSIVGGGGVAPLSCSEPDICELQKMYFLPVIRGQGLAKKLALMALDHAREQGFKRCYLETTAFLREAIALYERLGFEHISEPLGCTGHVDCEVRMLKVL
ncbi:GNAT family N-acetyltransferase [Salmonella enterica]